MRIDFNTNTIKSSFGDLTEYDSAHHLDIWSRDPGDCYFPNPAYDFSNENITYWDKKLLRIPERTQQEMHDLGEYFHKFSNSELKGLCLEAYLLTPWKIRGVYNKLLEAIQDVRAEREEIQQTINQVFSTRLNMKNKMEKTCKEMINNKFVEPIKHNYPAANGFFIHGDETEDIKNHIQYHLEEKIKPLAVAENSQTDDMKTTFEKLKKFATNTLSRHQKYNKWHGLFIINNFDDFLIPPQNKQELKLQSELQNFVKHCAEKYKTTVFCLSESNSKANFKNSQFAKELIPLQISNYFSDSDKELYTQLQEKIKRLDQKATEAYLKFKK